MPTGWFGKISWTVFLHCKSTAIIWLHNTHENTPERKYKMPDYILQFFNSSDYDVEMECRNAIYSKIWTEETTVGLR